MAWVPSSKYYSCSKCRANFLFLFDSLQLRIKKAGGRGKKGGRELVLIALAIIATVYVCYRIVISLYENVPQQ